MGAQTVRRLNQYIDQYEMMAELSSPENFSRARSATLDGMDDQIPPYYYGSHYSTPLGCVLHYLLRKEPFTQQHVLLQDGHFDVPDRLFYSASVTTKACLENPPEVKELVPEWFFDPHFLLNENRLTFGTTQDNVPINNVAIESSSSLFISQNLQALDSPITSAYLSDWIDLIFGYKQQGKPAAANYNVFFYLTYPDNCDVTNVQDTAVKSSVQTQAMHFGQCPQLVFDSPHIRKLLPIKAARSLRNVLFETPRESIYHESPRRWMGSRCRIQSISDWDASALQSCVSTVQNILGEGFNEPDRESAELSWPRESSYPWTITVDSMDYIEMTLLRVVLKVPDALSYNIKNHCFEIEYLNEQRAWTPIELITENSILQQPNVVTILSFKTVITRFWRVRIIDIPFTDRFLKLDVNTKPVYTCGDRSRDASSIPTNSFVVLSSPIVRHLDIMGRPLFPHAPSKEINPIGSALEFKPSLLALW